MEAIPDYSFGFNDVKYSDRTLLLEIANTDGDCSPDLKRTRCDHCFITATAAPVLKTIHINSLILAARSPFFRKLFSNGMQESEKKHVKLRIETSEEVCFMDLLKYVYSGKLPNTADALLDLLLISDKFEVDSCLRGCTQALKNLPMSCELGLVCLGLPPSLLMSATVQPLIDAVKLFIVASFKNLDKCKEEVINLPLLGIQVLLSSDDLQVTSECAVYDFVLTWTRKHHSNLEERRGILKAHLLPLVRFPLMSTKKLIEEVLTCSDIDPEVASKIVMHALHYKAETPHRQRCLAAEEANPASRQFVERAYKLRPIKVVELALPHPQCIIYLHLPRKKMLHIFNDGEIRSETYHLEGVAITLLTTLRVDNDDTFSMGLELFGSAACTVKYEIAFRTTNTEEFVTYVKQSLAFNELGESIKKFYGFRASNFIVDDSGYNTNGVIHVRVELTIKK